MTNNAPIEFIIPPQTEHWTDLSQSYLYVKFKIVKADGQPLDADSNVAPVNNFLHSMFSSVDLYLNNKLISSNSDTYPYRAYIENLLSYNADSSVYLRTLAQPISPHFSPFFQARTTFQKNLKNLKNLKKTPFLAKYIIKPIIL